MILVILISTLLVSGVIPSGDEEDDLTDEGNGGRVEVRFRTGSGDLFIDCAVARTAEEKSRGLMYNTTMTEEQGMIFVYERPQTVSYWMKNTYLDLDIIFISEDLEVMKVAEADSGYGIPDHELEKYESGGPCLYVVELKKGVSESNGIEPGVGIHIG